MAKRFTDTGKWDKAWFRKLSPELKCAWIFLCDRCDHAGLWDIDEEAFQYFIGSNVGLDEILMGFGDKVERVDETKILITGFIDFQYGKLNPENRVHKSVIDRLQKLAPSKPLKRTLQGPKDKDKDKDKEKDKEKESNFDFETVYQKYPRHEGKGPGMKRLPDLITTQKDFDDFKKAVENYASLVKERQTKPEHIKLWSSFVGKADDYKPPAQPPWHDYINIKTQAQPTSNTTTFELDRTYLTLKQQGPPDGDLTTLSGQRAQQLGIKFSQLTELVNVWWRDLGAAG